MACKISENRHFWRHHFHLKPPRQRSPANIYRNLILLETAIPGLHFSSLSMNVIVTVLTYISQAKAHCTPWSFVEWCSCTFHTRESLSARHMRWQPRRACRVDCPHSAPVSICRLPCTPSAQEHCSDTAHRHGNSFKMLCNKINNLALSRLLLTKADC